MGASWNILGAFSYAVSEGAEGKPSIQLKSSSWEGGKRAGSGVYTYSNGDVYRGEWADDVKQGEGVYSSKATLSSYQGTFEGGAFARGEWLQSDGSRYTGAFAGGKPSGDGEFFSVSSGNSTKGFFDATGAWTTTEVA